MICPFSLLSENIRTSCRYVCVHWGRCPEVTDDIKTFFSFLLQENFSYKNFKSEAVFPLNFIFTLKIKLADTSIPFVTLSITNRRREEFLCHRTSRSSNQQSCVLFRRCRVKNSSQRLTILCAVFRGFRPRKCQDITLKQATPLPSTSFPIYNSEIIFPCDAK